ncbi:Gluconokinase [Cronobacter universalis NCTC 9529]|nr:Gluconokinase [Cronobacter universalis NCTC 9529]
MLVTQFEALEAPQEDEKDVLFVDINQSLDDVIDSTIALINKGE